MSACKCYKKQIALLAAGALDEHERSAVTEHLKRCASCHAYSKQLEGITILYAEDAERPVETLAPLRIGSAKRRGERWSPWFKLSFGVAVLTICATLFLWRQPPTPSHPIPAGPTVAVNRTAPVAPSIGNTRHLAEKELDELLQVEMPGASRPTEVVFAVRTRPAAN